MAHLLRQLLPAAPPACSCLYWMGHLVQVVAGEGAVKGHRRRQPSGSCWVVGQRHHHPPSSMGRELLGASHWARSWLRCGRAAEFFVWRPRAWLGCCTRGSWSLWGGGDLLHTGEGEGAAVMKVHQYVILDEVAHVECFTMCMRVQLKPVGVGALGLAGKCGGAAEAQEPWAHTLAETHARILAVCRPAGCTSVCRPVDHMPPKVPSVLLHTHTHTHTHDTFCLQARGPRAPESAQRAAAKRSYVMATPYLVSTSVRQPPLPLQPVRPCLQGALVKGRCILSTRPPISCQWAYLPSKLEVLLANR